MSGFYCGICGKNSDETEANFWEDQIVCSSCYGNIKEDEEIDTFQQESLATYRYEGIE